MGFDLVVDAATVHPGRSCGVVGVACVNSKDVCADSRVGVVLNVADTEDTPGDSAVIGARGFAGANATVDDSAGAGIIIDAGIDAGTDTTGVSGVVDCGIAAKTRGIGYGLLLVF
ncbi:MAG: hypothetical protein V2A73_05110 [Pseudomonadota bacterium]